MQALSVPKDTRICGTNTVFSVCPKCTNVNHGNGVNAMLKRHFSPMDIFINLFYLYSLFRGPDPMFRNGYASVFIFPRVLLKGTTFVASCFSPYTGRRPSKGGLFLKGNNTPDQSP